MLKKRIGSYLADKLIADQKVTAQQFGRTTTRVFNFNAHILANFGYFQRLVVVLNAGYTAKIDKFL